MKRRTLLKGAGAATLVVIGGGVWRATERGAFGSGKGPGYELWKTWRDDAHEGPLALVAAAVLAASPHNTQPWLFKVTETQIELYADTARNLGAFDPYLREMHLGLGCALENLLLAATARGYETEVTYFPGVLSLNPVTAEAALVAHIDLSPGASRASSLYEAIPRRHTHRGPYDINRPLPSTELETMSGMVETENDVRLMFFTAADERARFGNAVVAATKAIIGDDSMARGSEKWFRHTRNDIRKSPDGITLDTAGLSPFMTAVAKMLPTPPAEKNHQYWLDLTREVHVITAPVFGFILVRDLYDRPRALRAGRIWQRMHLWATTRGIAMQPINQPTEMVDRERFLRKTPLTRRALDELTGDAAWRPTFAFRAGYPLRKALASPRRRVAQVLV